MARPPIESTAFVNRPVRWQRSEEGEAEEARLIYIDIIQEIRDARETVTQLSCRPDIPLSPTADTSPAQIRPPNPPRRERPLPLLSRTAEPL